MFKSIKANQTIDTFDQAKKADYNTKITEIEEKTPDHGKYIAVVFYAFSGKIFDERLKQVLNDLNTVEQDPIKNEENIEK